MQNDLWLMLNTSFLHLRRVLSSSRSIQLLFDVENVLKLHHISINKTTPHHIYRYLSGVSIQPAEPDNLFVCEITKERLECERLADNL